MRNGENCVERASTFLWNIQWQFELKQNAIKQLWQAAYWSMERRYWPQDNTLLLVSMQYCPCVLNTDSWIIDWMYNTRGVLPLVEPDYLKSRTPLNGRKTSSSILYFRAGWHLTLLSASAWIYYIFNERKLLGQDKWRGSSALYALNPADTNISAQWWCGLNMIKYENLLSLSCGRLWPILNMYDINLIYTSI